MKKMALSFAADSWALHTNLNVPMLTFFVKKCNIHEIACQKGAVKVFRRLFK